MVISLLPEEQTVLVKMKPITTARSGAPGEFGRHLYPGKDAATEWLKNANIRFTQMKTS